jgi:phosphoglycolate phosphatase
MNTSGRFAAVIFDLDGTLLDTLIDIGHAANSVLRHFHYPAHPIDDYRYFVGEGVRILFQRALPEAENSEQTVEACAAEFREAYGRLWNVHTRPYADVESLLAALARRSLPMAVLSNKPQRFTQLCVDEFFPAQTFRAVVGQRDGVPQKPDPAGAREIAEQLAVPPGKVLFLGDTGVDMQTARAAGMYAVGAQWGFRPKQELIAGGAQALIEQPSQLLALLQDDQAGG